MNAHRKETWSEGRLTNWAKEEAGSPSKKMNASPRQVELIVDYALNNSEVKELLHAGQIKEREDAYAASKVRKQAEFASREKQVRENSRSRERRKADRERNKREAERRKSRRESGSVQKAFGVG